MDYTYFLKTDTFIKNIISRFSKINQLVCADNRICPLVKK